MFYDIYSELCLKRNKSVYKVCTEIGLNRSAVAKWKTGAVPNGKTLSAIADYFGVSIDYLLGDDDKEKTPLDASKKVISIEERTEQYMAGLVSGSEGTLMLNGEPASPEALEALRASIAQSIEMARRINEIKKKGE